MEDLSGRWKRVLGMQGTACPDGPQCLQRGGFEGGGAVWELGIISWAAHFTLILSFDRISRDPFLDF